MRDDLFICSNIQVSLRALIITQNLNHQKKLAHPYSLLPSFPLEGW